MSSGYFKASLTTARMIADAGGDAETLLAWLTLRRFAFGEPRELTAAGSKAIGAALGVTWRRSKRLLDELLSMRFGERGEHPLVTPARDWNALHGTEIGARRKNADVYVTPVGDGPHAYLHEALIPGSGKLSDLAPLCALPGKDGLDAILVFLRANADLAVGDFLGADPASFVCGEWNLDGYSEFGDAYQLGYIGSLGPKHYWLAESLGDWAADPAIEYVTDGTSEAHRERFLRALGACESTGILHRVAIVVGERARLMPPLWISHRGKARQLESEWGIVESARTNAAEAVHAGADEIASLYTELNRDGGPSGLYVIRTDGDAPPCVLTVIAPTMVAPTPRNVEELEMLSARWRQA